jgi:hypothetical protein
VIATRSAGIYSEELVLTRLYHVSNLLDSGDFLYDLYFGEHRLVAVRSARRSLCRVAVGMAGVTISNKPLSIQQLTDVSSKNVLSIPYAEVTLLTIAKDLKSQTILQLEFVRRRPMIFPLDANQFETAKRELPKIP